MAQSVSFQFQYGTIKTPKYIVKFSPVNDFNSIVVQLKQSDKDTLTESVYNFNSIVVQLKRNCGWLDCCKDTCISIP